MIRALAATAWVAGLLGCATPQAPLLPEGASGTSARALVFGERDMVAAANPLAVDAGVAMLARGGSAVDAAIAAQLVLNLVEPQSSGIGGGGFLLHHAARGERRVYDGRETAPAAADAALLLDADGRALRKRDAIDGGLSVGVPGLARMLEQAHRDHGRLPWAVLFEPAIRLADNGFAIPPRLAAAIDGAASRLCGEPAARAYFLEPGSCRPKAVGSLLINKPFAETLRRLAREGAQALHTGPLADEIVAAVRSHPTRPGRLSLEDLARYQARVRDPVCGPYRGYTVCGVPPPSSGGVTLLQVLGILERFDLRALAPGSPDLVHLVTEAYRLAYADRGRHLADDAFVDVPVAGLLERNYLGTRAALLRADRSIGRAPPGEPAGARSASEDRSDVLPSTTHLSVVDAEGNAVALTSSIENGLGSLQMVGGFLLNNQLTDFAFTANGDDGRLLANRVQPGKRPLSTMSPVMVFGPGGRLEAVLGSPGGIAIVPFVTKTLVALMDHGLPIDVAIAAPNFGAENSELTWLERGTAIESVGDALRARGHRVGVFDLNSGLHAIVLNADAQGPGAFSRRAGAGRWAGAADPRRDGSARGSSAAPAR
jgi:gamma-glutamyltranspeptidase/glutathione hydrolase